MVATYGEFLYAVLKAVSMDESWRTGQAVFNVLASMRSDLSEQIRGKPLDPFYHSRWEDISPALEWIRANW